jgi:hypothetical protein
MKPALEKMDSIFRDQINQTVFLSDSPGPDARAESFQRLGFALACERVAHNGLD